VAKVRKKKAVKRQPSKASARKKKVVKRQPSKAPVRKKKVVKRQPSAPKTPPKKKAPPKKAKPHKLPVLAGHKPVGRPTLTTMEMPPEAHPGWLRKVAGIHYQTDLVHRCTVRQMYESEMFPGISLSQLSSWADHDHWNDLRKRYEAEFQYHMERRRGMELARARVKEMTKAQKLFDKMMGKLGAKKQPEVRSYEGLATAVVRVGTYIEQLRDVQLDQSLLLQPPMPVAGEDKGPSSDRRAPELTPEEAREAARAILNVRRERIRAELGIEDEAADGKILE